MNLNSRTDGAGGLYLKAFLGIWLFVLGFSYLKTLAGIEPFAFRSSFVIVVWLMGFLVGLYIANKMTPRGLPPIAEPVIRSQGYQYDVLAVLLFAFAFAGHFVWNRYAADTSGLSLAEVRSNRLATMETARPLLVTYMFYIADLSLYVGAIAVVAGRAKPITRIVCFVFFALIAVITFRKTGSRFPVIAVSLVIVCSYLIFHSKTVMQSLRRHIAIGLLALFALVSANAVLNLLRFEGGSSGRHAGVFDVRGGYLLKNFGIIDTLTPLNTAVGLLDEYRGNAVSYFDSYITENAMEPQHGRFMFKFIWQRYKPFDWYEIKAESDDVLSAIGIDYNVWCTALREVWVDFGWITPLSGPILGFSVAFAYRRRFVYSGFGILAALLSAWLLFSPFTSIHKNFGFELGLYLSIMLITIEGISGRSILDFSNNGNFVMRRQISRR